MEEREEEFRTLMESIQSCTLEAIEDLDHSKESRLNQILEARENSIIAMGILLETAGKIPGSDGYPSEKEMLIQRNSEVLKRIHDLDFVMNTLASKKMEEIKDELKSIKTERMIQCYYSNPGLVSTRLDLKQ